MSTQTVTLRLVADNGQLVGTVRASKAEIDGLGRGAQQAGGAAEQGFGRASAAAERTSTFVTRARQAVAGFVLAAASIQGLQSLSSAATAAEAASRSFEAALGSAERGGLAFDYARGEAQALGLELQSSASSFAKFQAASQGTALAGAGAAKVFTAISEASTVLGLSAESTEGALNALQQMVSKGTVQAEELRGQLGERLPGAFQIAARAMGMTTAELGKALEQGQVMAEDMLPNLADELSRMYSGAAQRAANGLQANLNRMRTAIFDLRVAIGESGFADALNVSAIAAASFAQQLAAVARANAEAFGETEPLLNWGEVFRAVSENAILFFARIPDFVRSSAVLMVAYAVDAGTQIGAAFERVGNYAKTAAVVIYRAFAEGFDFVVATAATAARKLGDVFAAMGADGIAGSLRAASEAATQFSGALVAQADVALDALAKERAGIAEKAAESRRTMVAVQNEVLTEVAAREQARQAAVAQAGAVKRVAAESLGAGAAAAKAAADGKAAAEAAKQAAKQWKDYQEQLARSADALEDAERDVQADLTYQQELNRLLRAGVDASEAEAQVRRAMEPIRSNELDTARAQLDAEKQITEQLKRRADAERDLFEQITRKQEEMGIGTLPEFKTDAFEKFMALDVGRDFAAGFDEASASLGKFVERFDTLAAVMKSFAEVRAQGFKSLEQQAQAEQKYQRAQIQLYGDLAGSAKGFFAEGSDGYRILEKAERGFRAVELALSAKSLAAKLFATQASTAAAVASVPAVVAAEGAKATAAGTAAAASSMVGIPFPANLAALAATVAALAALGVVLKGGGGGGGYTPTPASQGRGTVLGDREAMSESIGSGLDQLVSLAERQLDVSYSQLRTLQSIEAGLSRTASAIAQAAGASNIRYVGGAVQRIDIAPGQTIGGVISGGLQSQFARDPNALERYLELLGADASRLYTERVVPRLQAQIGEVFAGIVDSIQLGAAQIGLGGDELRARIESLALRLTSIDLEGLEGDEITARINAVFSGVGDTIVQQLLPQVAQFQKVGEGLLETLVRLASQTSITQGAIEDLGIVFRGTSEALVAASDDLAARSGGLEAYSEGLSQLLDLVLTEAEKSERLQRQLSSAFDTVNLALPGSVDGLRTLVQGLDLTSEAGREAFSVIIQNTEALRVYYEQMQSGAEALAEAARIESEKFFDLTEDSQRVRDNFAAAVDSSARILELLESGWEQDSGPVQAERRRILTRLREEERDLQATFRFFTDSLSSSAEEIRAAVERAAFGERIFDDKGDFLSDETLNTSRARVYAKAAADISANALRLGNAGDLITQLQQELQIAIKGIDKVRVAQVAEKFEGAAFGLELLGDSVDLLAKTVVQVRRNAEGFSGDLADYGPGLSRIRALRTAPFGKSTDQTYVDNMGGILFSLRVYEAALEDGSMTAETVAERVQFLSANLETLTGVASEGTSNLQRLSTTLNAGLEAFYSAAAINARSLENEKLRQQQERQLYVAGLQSLNYYFDQLGQINTEFAADIKADPAIAAAEQVLGRLKSAASAFGESVQAVADGVGDLRKLSEQMTFTPRDGVWGADGGRVMSEAGNFRMGSAIADAAARLADIVTTRTAYEAQQSLAGNAAFAGADSVVLRDISRLVESVSAFDSAGLERAFVRASVALRDGTITLDQYTALIDYSQSVYLGASAALEDLTGSAENLEAIARERAGLERQLLELQGDTAAIRALERAEINAANLDLYDRINALRDEQAAAQAAAEIAREREGLETRLLQLQDNTAALRARERSALDASNQSLYDQITALEDQRAATDAAAASARDLASAQQARDTALRSLQAYGERLADEINQIRLQALADVNTARGGVIDALDRLAQASEASSEALAEAQRQVADGIGDYLRELRGTTAGSGNAFERRDFNAAQFRDVSSRALSGDITAAQGIVAAAQAYLGSVRETAGSSIEIAREEGRVRAQLLAVQALNAVGVETQTDAVATAADAQRAYTEALSAATAAGIEYTRTVDSGADTFRLALNAYNEAQDVATQVRADMAEQEQSVLDRYRGLVSQMEEFQAKTAGILESLKPIDELGGLLQEYADAVATLKMAEATALAKAALIAQQAQAQAIANAERLTAQLGGNSAAAQALLNNATTGANTPLPGVEQVAAAATQIVGSLDAAAAAIAASAVPLRAEVTAAGIELRAFARGGSYPGGLALVGEEGPELINFSAPGQVYNAAQTRQALGTDTRKLEALVERMSTEIVALKTELREIGRNTDQTASQLRRVIRDGKLIVGEEADA